MKVVIMIVFSFFLSVGCVAEEIVDETLEQEKEVGEINPIIDEEPTEEMMIVEKEETIVEVEPRYKLEGDYTVKPIDETSDERVILLTIDDAPEHYALEMAQLLKENDINAIFFVNGHFIHNQEGSEKLKAIYDLGFEIGNHTMTHPNLRDLTEDEQRAEIIQLNDRIEEITGERPRFFRAPFGVNTETSKKIVEEENMQWMNWTYGYDYFKEYMNKEALADIMVNTNLLRPGANLLMHDRKWTLDALPEIINGLKEKGYSFVDPKMIQ